MVKFAPPTLQTYTKYKPFSSTLDPATTNIVKAIPGISTRGLKGSVESSESAYSRANVEPVKSSLDIFQEGLKNKLAASQKYNDQVKQRQSEFQKKYGVNASKYAVKKAYQQAMPNPQPAGQPYGGGRSNGRWGNFANGYIPSKVMTQIAPGHFLRSDAASAFARMNSAFYRTFGRPIAISDSYRSYDRQVLLKRTKPGLAARPGTSNHGWGLALDLGGGINRHGTAENRWMRQNAASFGFAPLSGRMGALEPWHWEFRG